MKNTTNGAKMKIKLDEKAIMAIEAALTKGNNAEVKRKGDGVVVMEVKRTITHSTFPIGGK